MVGKCSFEYRVMRNYNSNCYEILALATLLSLSLIIIEITTIWVLYP